MDSKSAIRLLALASVMTCLATAVGCDQRYSRRERRENRAEVRARCGQYIDRIETDRRKLADMESGHEKARQWFEDDMRDAQRDFDRCRDSG